MSRPLLTALALSALLIYGCGDQATDSDSPSTGKEPTSTASGGSGGSGAPSGGADRAGQPQQPNPPRNRRPKREFVDLKYTLTMVCRVNCPKRLEHAVRQQGHAIVRVRPDFYKGTLEIRADKAKVDVARIDRDLRRAGYPNTLVDAGALSKDTPTTFTAPVGDKLVIEVSGYSKMAGCSRATNGGPPPHAVFNAVEQIVGEQGFVEMNLHDDQITIHLDGSGGVTYPQLIEAVETTGAKARKFGDRGDLPTLVKGALERAKGKPVLIEISSPT